MSNVNIGSLVGTVSLEDRFSKALDLIGSAAEKFTHKTESNFKAVAIGATAVVTAITGIASTVAYLATKGSQLNDLEAGFNKLAGGVGNAEEIMKAMNKGVADTVDSTELLEFANRALQTGAIKTAKGFETVTSAARVLSRQGLGPVPSILNTINQALSTGRARSLQYLTGVVDLKGAEEQYAKSIGRTRSELSAQQKIQADRIAIMEALNRKVAQAGDLEKSFAEKLTTARLAVGNWFDDIAKAVAKSPAVNKALDAIGASLIKNFGGTASSAAETIVMWVEKFADGVAYYGPIVIDWVRKVIDGVRDIWQSVQRAWSLVPDWFKNIAKEAAIAGGAIYVTKGLMDKISGGIAGTGGGLLGDTASGATIISGLHSMIDLASKAKSGLLGMAAGAKMVADVFKFGWATGGVLGTLDATLLVVESLTMAVVGSSFFTAGIWATVAYGVYAIGDSFYHVWKMWREGKLDREEMKMGLLAGALSIFPNSGDGPAARRRRARKTPQPMKDTYNAAGMSLLSDSPNKGTVPGVGIGDYEWDVVADESEQALKRIEDATKSSVDRTTGLWSQYFASVDQMSGDETRVKLGDLDRWYDAERATLDRSMKDNRNYWNERIALDNLAAQKRMAIFAEVEKAFAHPGLTGGLPNVGDVIGANDSRTQVGEIDLPRLSSKMLGNGMLGPVGQDPGTDFGSRTAKHFLKGFSAGIADAPRILINALTGGGSLFDAVSAIGVSITDKLFGEGGSMANVTKAFSDKLGGLLSKGLGDTLGKALGSAIGGLLPIIGGLVGPLIDKIMSIGGPSKKELEGRDVVKQFESQFKNLDDLLAQLTAAYGGTEAAAARARAEMTAAWDAETQGAEATQAAVDRMNAALDAHQEVLDAIGSAGFKSTDDLAKAADLAKRVWEEMRTSGKYSIEDIAKAWQTYEEAQARALGDPNQTLADMAKAAGYETQEDLSKAAEKARELAEYMQRSGKYTAEAIEDAFDKANEAQARALGMNTKVMSELRSQIDTLTKGIEAEAPEAVMGVIEAQMRAQREDLEKQLEAQKELFAHAGDGAADAAATAGDAASEAADKAAKDWSKYADDLGAKLHDKAIVFGDDFTGEGERAAGNLRGIFDGLEFRVHIGFDYDQIERPDGLPMAAGGAGHASGPMTFTTKGDEDWMFSGEGKSFGDMFQQQRPNVTLHNTTYVGRKLVKDEVINELDESPTSRDARVLASVGRIS